MNDARLTRQDWMTAALRALARGGVSAVAVNAMAADLGVTRGSFYWHFKSRHALLEAALEWWEKEGTEMVIERVVGLTDPRQRMRRLFQIALGDDPTEGLEPALVAHADDPVVAPILRRVTERRLDFLTEQYRDAGLPPAEARRQAVVTYATYVGWIELRRAAPEAAPETAASDLEAMEFLIERFLPAMRSDAS